MADLTSDEFAHKYLNYAGLEQYGLQRPTETMNNTTAPKGIPEAYDWSTISGKMNPVQDQGSCGSCWSFASTAVLESVNAIKHGNLPKLSPDTSMMFSLMSSVPHCLFIQSLFHWSVSPKYTKGGAAWQAVAKKRIRHPNSNFLFIDLCFES